MSWILWLISFTAARSNAMANKSFPILMHSYSCATATRTMKWFSYFSNFFFFSFFVLSSSSSVPRRMRIWTKVYVCRWKRIIWLDFICSVLCAVRMHSIVIVFYSTKNYFWFFFLCCCQTFWTYFHLNHQTFCRINVFVYVGAFVVKFDVFSFEFEGTLNRPIIWFVV